LQKSPTKKTISTKETYNLIDSTDRSRAREMVCMRIRKGALFECVCVCVCVCVCARARAHAHQQMCKRGWEGVDKCVSGCVRVPHQTKKGKKKKEIK